MKASLAPVGATISMQLCDPRHRFRSALGCNLAGRRPASEGRFYLEIYFGNCYRKQKSTDLAIGACG